MSVYRWMVGHTSRVTYWSHSKLAEWIRAHTGVESELGARTAGGWREYKRQNDHKIGQKIADGLDDVQDIVLFPYDVYRNIRQYILNRFIDRPWCLDTKLAKGEWHEMDSRIVHGLFETLVDFVEHEKAAMQYRSDMWNDGNEVKVKRVYPSREKGLEYLDWEISLGEESPSQADAAQEIKELYLWWKDVRPNRPDPMEASGWSQYCDDLRAKSSDDSFWALMDRDDETEEEREYSMKLIRKSNEIEIAQENEDTEMMIRLIKIRKSMWT